MNLGITSIQRNRAPWIKEWVAFHSLVGFNKFYILLHGCSDETEKILKGLQKKYDIEINIVDSSNKSPQAKFYMDSYKKHGEEVAWMAFIDADEFLFPTACDSMEEALGEFEDKKISALGVYWSCFGSSGHSNEPGGLIIENYKYRAKDGYHNNRHVKSLVRGGLGEELKFFDYHTFITPNGTVDENLRPVSKGWTDYEPTYKKLRINHYVTQSQSFFLNFKSKYGTPDGNPPRDQSYWEEHDRNEILDISMDRFIKPLKKILKSL